MQWVGTCCAKSFAQIFQALAAKKLLYFEACILKFLIEDVLSVFTNEITCNNLKGSSIVDGVIRILPSLLHVNCG
jgi:hypothetical protein